jgi:glycine/D-amino acid oxidase-like deaminating enzyme
MTDASPRHAGVLVIGGGAAGLAVALHAARHADPLASPVVLLEREDFGAGSSGHGCAVLATDGLDPALADVVRDARREYAGFFGRTGRSVGFHAGGVATPGVGELDAAALRARLPGLSVPDDARGGFEDAGAFVDPARVLAAFAALARTNGAVTRMGVAAERVLVADGRALGAETTEGTYLAERVVVAAGAWSRALLAELDVDVPLVAARLETHRFAGPGPRPKRASRPAAGEAPQDLMARIAEFERAEQLEEAEEPTPALVDPELGIVAHEDPVSGGLLLDVALGTEAEGPPDDEAGTPEVDVRALLELRFPQLADRALDRSLVTWRTRTPDGRPLVGPVPGVAGLALAAGFGDHAVGMAPRVGHGLAQWLDGEPVTSYDAAAFDPARFAG